MSGIAIWKLRCGVVLALVVGLGGCSTEPIVLVPPPLVDPIPSSPSELHLAPDPEGVVDLSADGGQAAYALSAAINGHRIKRERTLLRWDAVLYQVALQRAKALVLNADCLLKPSLACGNGDELAALARDRGYGFRTILEIAYVSLQGAFDPEEAVRRWAQSPPHADNLTHPAVDEVGVAVIQSGGVVVGVAVMGHRVSR